MTDHSGRRRLTCSFRATICLEGMLEWPDRGGARGRGRGGASAPAARRHHGAAGRLPGGEGLPGARPGLPALQLPRRGAEPRPYSGIDEYRDVQAAGAFLRGQAGRGGGRRGAGARNAAAGACRLLLRQPHGGERSGRRRSGRPAGEGSGPHRLLARLARRASRDLRPVGGLQRPRAGRIAENDDLGYPEDVERTLRRLGLDLTMAVIEGAGHFLEDRHREVGEIVATFFAEKLALSRPLLD